MYVCVDRGKSVIHYPSSCRFFLRGQASYKKHNFFNSSFFRWRNLSFKVGSLDFENAGEMVKCLVLEI